MRSHDEARKAVFTVQNYLLLPARHIQIPAAICTVRNKRIPNWDLENFAEQALAVWFIDAIHH
jgi:hypothetical protein